MDWEQKMMALAALKPEISLKMRKREDWYVDTSGISIGGNGRLTGLYSKGKTPSDAIEETWAQIEGLPSDYYLFVSSSDSSKRVRWAGFMWVEVVL